MNVLLISLNVTVNKSWVKYISKQANIYLFYNLFILLDCKTSILQFNLSNYYFYLITNK